MTSEDDPTKEIQKFLVSHLKLTPRRQLFEDYDKTASAKREEEANRNDKANHSISESMNKFNLDIISKLNDFRQEHPSECMSGFNQQRFRRAKENEEKLKKEHRFMFNDRILEMFHEDMKRRKETENRRNEPARSNKPSSDTVTFHYAPDNSLALSHQKFKP